MTEREIKIEIAEAMQEAVNLFVRLGTDKHALTFEDQSGQQYTCIIIKS